MIASSLTSAASAPQTLFMCTRAPFTANGQGRLLIKKVKGGLVTFHEAVDGVISSRFFPARRAA